MSSDTTSPSNPNGPTGKLCNWIHDTKISDIPQEFIERAKYLILDGIACAFVASHLPWSEVAAKAIMKMDPQGQCTVIGWEGRKLPPLSAALLNSTFIQGFELDDYHSKAPLHSNSLASSVAKRPFLEPKPCCMRLAMLPNCADIRPPACVQAVPKAHSI